MFAKVFLLLAILLIGSTVALELSAATFDSEVVNSDEAWLVEFYSPMCGSCSEFSPSWDKIEKNFKSSLSIGKVNIDKKENMKLAEDLGVLDEGLPNVRLFNKKGQSKGTSIPVGMLLKVAKLMF